MPAVANNEGPRFKGFDAQSMAATVVGAAFHLWIWASAGAHSEWTGGTGTISFEGSNNSTNGIDGNWRPITITITNQPAGVAGGELTDLTGVPWEWVRPVYTRASGTGVLNLWFTGKGRRS
jgi:hypothetical protein